MNGFIKQTTAVICFGAGVLALIGCTHYREHVDPCWPERYNKAAQYSVKDMHNAQAFKGHILNQTVWEDDFDGNKLKKSGMAKLHYIANREPTPAVMKLWLQNSDLSQIDPKKREKLEGDPAEYKKEQDRVNAARLKAIMVYLETQRAGTQRTLYEIDIHNYEQPTYRADWTDKALQNLEKNIQAGRQQIFITPSVSGTK
ncbi:MAG: hypothetical protein HYX68_02910 [Planctomycetes bacterium]|nr:hypothetical protein [Planctomycetota bacterium]